MSVYAFDMLIRDFGAGFGQSPLQRLIRQARNAAADTLLVKSGRAARPKARRADLDCEDVRQSRRGDSDAYRRLVERHQEHVGHIMWRFSRDRRVHEELVQDVFVEAYMSLGTYAGKAPFEHWLARIATRVGYRYWKQSQRQREAEPFSIEEWDRVARSTQEPIDAIGAGELVHKMMAQLPPRDRLVLTLRFLDECDVAETARRTGWTKAMVKVQTLRARKKLQRIFDANWRDENG